jgi:hypothetical protein
MLNILKPIAKELNANVLNFNLWFRRKVDDYLIGKFPKSILKEYPNAFYKRDYVVENFYTNEYYLLRETAINTTLDENRYYIFDIYSLKSKKRILSFVSKNYFNHSSVEPLDYIYLLTNDELVRVRNKNRYMKRLQLFLFYYITSIPFVYHIGHRVLAYSLFNSNHVKLPCKSESSYAYYCKYVLGLYNSDTNTSTLVNPFDLNLYLQCYTITNDSEICKSLNVLI